MTGGRHRSTGEVLESHLAYAQRGDLEGDLATNFAEDVVLLSAEGVHRGHDGVRTLRSILDDYVPAGSYEYCQLEAEGSTACSSGAPLPRTSRCTPGPTRSSSARGSSARR